MKDQKMGRHVYFKPKNILDMNILYLFTSSISLLTPKVWNISTRKCLPMLRYIGGEEEKKS